MFDWSGFSGWRDFFVLQSGFSGWRDFFVLQAPSYPAPGRGPSGVRAAKRAAVKRKNKARAKR